MIKTSIKALWQGMIPIRDVYVNRALYKETSLVVVDRATGKAYELTPEKLEKPRFTRRVKDHFSKDMQSLCYYGAPKEFNPQTKLI